MKILFWNDSTAYLIFYNLKKNKKENILKTQLVLHVPFTSYFVFCIDALLDNRGIVSASVHFSCNNKQIIEYYMWDISNNKRSLFF